MAKLATKLNVSLYDNPLTPEKDDYTAKVQLNGTLTNEQIANEIVAERTEYRPETILNILNISDEIKRTRLASGFAINDGVTQMYPAVSGRFVGAAAQFDSTVHSVGVTMVASSALRTAMSETKVVVQGPAPVGPVINKVLDVYTGKENNTITVNKSLKIFGQRLRIAGDNALVGIWFIAANESATRTRVADRDVVDNNPSQLTVTVPALAAGDYYVEVVTQASTGQILLKEPRSYRYDLALALKE